MKMPLISVCLALATASPALAELKISDGTVFGVVSQQAVPLCFPDGPETAACPRRQSSKGDRNSIATNGKSPLRISGTAKMGVGYDGDGWRTINEFQIKFHFSGTTDSGLSYGVHSDSQ